MPNINTSSLHAKLSFWLANGWTILCREEYINEVWHDMNCFRNERKSLEFVSEFISHSKELAVEISSSHGITTKPNMYAASWEGSATVYSTVPRV